MWLDWSILPRIEEAFLCNTNIVSPVINDILKVFNINNILRLYEDQKEKLRIEIDRYETGIERINAAEKEVAITQ